MLFGGQDIVNIRRSCIEIIMSVFLMCTHALMFVITRFYICTCKCRSKRAFLKLKDEKLQEEALSAQPHDSEEGKLTVTKRIQSALKIKKQSSLSEMPSGPSTQASMSAASEENPDVHNDQQRAITDTYRAHALDKVLPPTCTHTPSEKLPSSCTSETEDPLLQGNTSEHSHSQRTCKSPSAIQLHVSSTEEQHCVYRHSHQQKSVTFGDLVTRVDELDDEQLTLSDRSLEKKFFSQSPQTSIRNLMTKSDRQCNLYAQSNDSNSDLDYDQSSTSAALSPRKNNSSLSPKMPAQQLLSNTVDGSGSVVVKLMRSLSESDRKSLMLQLQQNSSISPSDGSELGGSNRSKGELLLQPSDMKMPPDTSQKDKIFDAIQTESESAPTSTSTSCTKMATNQETSTAKTVSEREAFQGPCVSTPHDQNTPLEKENQGQPVSSKEQMLAEEQRALALLVERRQTEELVAQLSRQRMNSLISEEELAKVSCTVVMCTCACIHVHVHVLLLVSVLQTHYSILLLLYRFAIHFLLL